MKQHRLPVENVMPAKADIIKEGRYLSAHLEYQPVPGQSWGLVVAGGRLPLITAIAAGCR